MKYHAALLIFVSLCATFFQSLMLVKSFGFDLIHKDSPLSPFYNKSSSQSEILLKDAHRSHAQVNRLRNSSPRYTKELVESIIETSYLLQYYLGSNKFKVFAFASLLSGFTWTKCLSENQKQGERFYKWDESTSYKIVPYKPDYRDKDQDYRCDWFTFSKPDPLSTDCAYQYEIDKHLSTKGVISMDKMSFYSLEKNKVVEFGNILFGCSRINEGFPSKVQGVLGLGRSTTSVLSRLNKQTKYKFSYCLSSLTSYEKKAIFRFGDNHPSTERSMTSIPFEGNTGYSDGTIDYYLRLEKVIIGDKNPIENPEALQRIRIDLGISMTYLPEDIYEEIEDMVTHMFDTDEIPLPEFKICFNNTSDNRNRLPKMKFHFRGAGIYELDPSNVFAEIDKKFCLAIFEVNDNEISVFGTKAQENHVMQFDVDNNRLSFTPPIVCSSY